MNNLPKSVGQYVCIRDVIGSGAFAIVIRGHHMKNASEQVAIKAVAKKNLVRGTNLLEKEKRILKELATLKHKNLVTFLSCEETETHVFLVMEYCNGGDLADYLHLKKKLEESVIKVFLRQIADAVCVIHSRGIVHRDLKPQNILISVPENLVDPGPEDFTLKVADFGFARFLQDGVMAGTLCGSPMYMAPEVLMSLKYDGKADLWSIGTIVYQCFVGHAPFQAKSPPVLRQFYEKNVELRPRIPSNASLEFADLVGRLLCRNPRSRMGLEALIEHPFLKSTGLLVRKSSIKNLSSLVSKRDSEQVDLENFEFILREEVEHAVVSMNSAERSSLPSDSKMCYNFNDSMNEESAEIDSVLNPPDARFQLVRACSGYGPIGSSGTYTTNRNSLVDDFQKLDFSLISLSSSVFNVSSDTSCQCNHVHGAFTAVSIENADDFIMWKAPQLDDDAMMDDKHNEIVSKILFVKQYIACILSLIAKKSSPLCRRENDVKAEIFVLQLKCMDLIIDSINLIKTEREKGQLKVSASVLSCVRFFNQWYAECLNAVSRFYNQLEKDQPLPDPNQLIFEHALATCMAATCDEYFDQNQIKCAGSYSECQILFHALSQQCTKQRVLLTQLRQIVESRLESFRHCGLVIRDK